MKKIITFCLFISQFALAQNTETKVWKLLLSNKRTEARKLFDQELKSKKNKTIDLFLLDNFIDLESGKSDYDETFVKTLATFPESGFYYCPLVKRQFILDEIQTVGFNDNTYKKIDALAQLAAFKDNPQVIYYKAIADRNRKDYTGYANAIKQLHSIMDWQLCGPFENLNDSGIDIEYEPEAYPKNDKSFDANSNGVVGWYNPGIIQNEGYQTFSNEDEYGNAIMYSQVFVDNPNDQEVIFNFGMSASMKIFVNDVEVYVNTLNRVSDLNAYKIKLLLPKGMNRILMKTAISKANSYFFLALTDTQNKPITNLTYYNTYKEYTKSTLSSLQVEEQTPDYEAYFSNKVKADPGNVLNKILLFDCYIHNKKVELAQDIIEDLDRQYPNSSMIKIRLAKYYNFKDDNQKLDEVKKNIEVQDPDYYFTLVNKAQDSDWISSVSIAELEKYRDRAKKLNSPMVGLLYDFFINARNSNMEAMISNLDDLFAKSNNSEFYLTSLAPLYDSLEKKKEKTIALLEGLLDKKENFTALAKLIGYYRDANRKEDVKRLFLERKKNYPYFNGVASDYISILIEEKKYTEALEEINNALANFPYSFYLLEQKGQVYNYMNNVKEAEKYMRQSLTHNSENSSLRKQLYDITKTPDEIEEIDIKDKYKIIKERRHSDMKSDYGVVTLLDEYIVNILPEGGRKSKIALAYEITTENGIEEMKEYKLNTYSITLQKSEIVKEDGSLVPADEGDGTLVFPNLKVGDVVYIEYESFSNSYGRFYKDFNLDCYFNSTFPTVESIFAIINPSDIKYNFKFSNGDITPTVKKINNKTCTIWKRSKIPALALLEPNSKNYNDLTNSINVSSIKDWKEISNWYADLVKKTLKLDKVTKSTFEGIFPNGVAGMTQDAIAKKIYTYIEENIKYSSQDFRQSGYVPQKPSKTITTKLGDCKDVSTLFVALAQLANMKANLVLVSTNDNSSQLMSLPSKEFNHCIVKTIIDGKEVFLELTDKYLPYKALPMSLYKANALVISFDKNENEKSSLINIPFDNAVKNEVITNSVVDLGDKDIKLINTQKIIGANKSYFNELFSTATSEDVRKKELEEDYNNKLKKSLKLENAKLITNNAFDDSIEFQTQLSVNEKIKSVGNLKIVDLPFIDKVYTRDIVAKETRNYDIKYITYENNYNYNSTIVMNIPADKKFTEIPENKNYTYKNHSYSISFELVKPNSLKVTRVVSTPWDNITAAEYPDYKKYVEEVIANEEQVVGFK
ncbi:transglutaminase domain-containing protein [Flavobacterium sp. XGLA_31]|uniref:transglutaminase domain-containing protein n=1 Tax=Flavobacterium sp. XGLA_31 TaxID=3447666 RepID=UPI003F333245